MRKITFILFATLLSAALSAQTLVESVSLSVNREDGIYAKGDTVRVWADVKTVPSAPVTFKVMRWCDWKAESATPVSLKEGRTLLFERVFNESVQYVFELTDGKAPKEFKAKGGKTAKSKHHFAKKPAKSFSSKNFHIMAVPFEK